MSDLDDTAAWCRANGGDPARLGVTGFCWGGRITWLYAAHNPSLTAAVAWYGRILGQQTALTPKNPIDLATAVTTPVLGRSEDPSVGTEGVSTSRSRCSQYHYNKHEYKKLNSQTLS